MYCYFQKKKEWLKKKKNYVGCAAFLVDSRYNFTTGTILPIISEYKDDVNKMT